MKKLIEGLRHFQNNVFSDKRELFERSVQGQKPQALLITCSDSRVLPETLMQADPGDLFVVRNAGNLVPLPEVMGGEAATISYAVEALGVTDLIVCGHYHCGAMKALIEGITPAPDSPVGAWLAHAANTRTVIENDHSHLEGNARWDKAVEQNVLLQIENLSKHPVVATGLASGSIRLHAWVLRFESSEVLAFSPSSNSFEPILGMEVVHPAMPGMNDGLARQATSEESPPMLVKTTKPSWLQILLSDLPASFVVFAVALPLCVAIAKASGVPTAAGIITAIIGGVVVGLLGGGPLQVSGPTAGLIIVLLGAQEKLGFTSLGIIVFLSGLIQVIAGQLRIGQWFRAISPAVILGMLAGIGVVLASQQFHVTMDDAPARSSLGNLVSTPIALLDVFTGHAGHVGHLSAGLIGLLTLSILLAWNRIVPKSLLVIPSVLAAVVIATTVASILDLPIQRVDFDNLSSGISVMTLSTIFSFILDPTVWQFAVTVALLASAESLLTASALDAMHSGPRTRYDRELTAQGIGNAACGLLGVLPLAGVIVRSSANLQAGAKSRLASILHGVWMLAFVLIAPSLLRLIPTSVLAAILVLTGIRLIQVVAIKALWKENRTEAMICIAVAVTTVAMDLLSGIMLGIGLSLIKLVYTFSWMRIRRRDRQGSNRVDLILDGAATFLRLPKLANALEAIPGGAELHVDFKGLSYIDHSCLTLLMNWAKQHKISGGRLILDWDALRGKFIEGRPKPRMDKATFGNLGKAKACGMRCNCPA